MLWVQMHTGPAGRPGNSLGGNWAARKRGNAADGITGPVTFNVIKIADGDTVDVLADG